MVDLEGCARCGGNHAGLEFKAFKKPMDPPEVFFTWEHWAMCPTTGEPVLTSTSWAFLTTAGSVLGLTSGHPWHNATRESLAKLYAEQEAQVGK
jgi:hypothetical protein